jgi:hypothetical protein
MPHRLSFEELPSPANGHSLVGKVAALDDAKFTDFPEVGIVPYLWTYSTNPGWQPATSSPILVPPHGRWSIRIATGLQYAALLVKKAYEPPEPANGTLPMPMGGIIDGLMGSPLKVVITVASALKLAGIVTGWEPTAYRPDSPRSRGVPPKEDLRLMVWADHDGFIDETRCEENGVWSLDIPEHYRNAERYWVALATPELRPNGVPRAKDERVRALTWHKRTDALKARAAGQSMPSGPPHE